MANRDFEFYRHEEDYFCLLLKKMKIMIKIRENMQSRCLRIGPYFNSKSSHWYFSKDRCYFSLWDDGD